MSGVLGDAMVWATDYANREDFPCLLEELLLETRHVRLVASFDDGDALYGVVCEQGLEDVAAKRERPYRLAEQEEPWLVTVCGRAGSRDLRATPPQWLHPRL